MPRPKPGTQRLRQVETGKGADIGDAAGAEGIGGGGGPAAEMRMLVFGEHIGTLGNEALDDIRGGAGEPARDGERGDEIAELVVPDAGRAREAGGLAIDLRPPDLVGIGGTDAEDEMAAGLCIGEEVGDEAVGGEIERGDDEDRELARKGSRIGDLEVGGIHDPHLVAGTVEPAIEAVDDPLVGGAVRWALLFRLGARILHRWMELERPAVGH
jgi:hypothetical protein